MLLSSLAMTKSVLPQDPVFAVLLSSLPMTTHNSDASQLACWPVVLALDTMSFSVRAENGQWSNGLDLQFGHGQLGSSTIAGLWTTLRRGELPHRN